MKKKVLGAGSTAGQLVAAAMGNTGWSKIQIRQECIRMTKDIFCVGYGAPGIGKKEPSIDEVIKGANKLFNWITGK